MALNPPLPLTYAALFLLTCGALLPSRCKASTEGCRDFYGFVIVRLQVQRVASQSAFSPPHAQQLWMVNITNSCLSGSLASLSIRLPYNVIRSSLLMPRFSNFRLSQLDAQHLVCDVLPVAGRGNSSAVLPPGASMQQFFTATAAMGPVNAGVVSAVFS